ncbi:MAG TPA: ROK family protein [Propionibacteriaceae bacterium]|mgnify:CR=1 FL=1|nr:ROK family protein [Propionibacteriaceae bacterium]HPZ48975.1 ROK family protein [Propionibacteriaceae bacterium]
MTARVSIGVDLGGTKIAAALVAGDGTVLARALRPTPSGSARELADAVADAVLAVGADDASVGLAVAGRVSADGDVMLQSANLGLRDVPLSSLVTARSGHPVRLLNDADAALLGEHWLGAARGQDDVLMVTLGTGVGGAALVAGRLLRGAHGAAGEIGHATVKHDGRTCACGGRGCLDRYASGRALARYGTRRSGTRVRTGTDVTFAARRGESWAMAAIGDLAGWLAIGLANAIALLDPALIVLAGGLGTAGEVVRGPVAERLDCELQRRGVPGRPPVTSAQLHSEAGAIGAAAYTSGRFS